MNIYRLQPWLIVAGLVLGTACQKTRSLPDTVLLALESADRLDVMSSLKQVKRIVQPGRIKKTAQLFEHYAKGWQKPLSGSPVPALLVVFHKGPNPLGSFGIGSDFLTMGEAHLWCQPLSAQERSDILKILAIEERTGNTP